MQREPANRARLSAGDLERARQIAAAAPAPGPDLIARLRVILAGCHVAAPAPRGGDARAGS